LGLWNWITSLEPNEYQSIYKRLKIEERNNQKKIKINKAQTQIEDGKDMTSFIYNIISFLLFS